MTGQQHETSMEVALHAAVVAVKDHEPLVLSAPVTAMGRTFPALPYGTFDPEQHRTMERGLRLWVEEQADLRVGYVEQLYTFGDRNRLRTAHGEQVHQISVGYLALVRHQSSEGLITENESARWTRWYDHFPWEDWRSGPPDVLIEHILPALRSWVLTGEVAPRHAAKRRARFHLAYGHDAAQQPDKLDGFDEERVLERYELMYEAGLVEEAVIDRQLSHDQPDPLPGLAMYHDHRRILATAMSRLRGKMKYRPVVFELMGSAFTLTDLQKTVESLSGHLLHKQNFRRLVDTANLVEPTGSHEAKTGGRPAALFRFREQVTRERPAPGLRV